MLSLNNSLALNSLALAHVPAVQYSYFIYGDRVHPSLTATNTGGTYIDANGARQDAPTDQVRVTHTSQGALLGVVGESQSPNSLHDSYDCRQWNAIGGAVKTDLGNYSDVFRRVSVASNGGSWHRIRDQQDFTLALNEQVAITVFYEAGTSNQAFIELRSTGGTYATVFVTDIAGGVFSSYSDNGSTFHNIQQKLEKDGRYKLTFGVTCGEAGTYALGVGPNTTVVGETIIALGGMIEKGTLVPSSFVKTSGGSAVRTADVITAPWPFKECVIIARFRARDIGVAGSKALTIFDKNGPNWWYNFATIIYDSIAQQVKCEIGFNGAVTSNTHDIVHAPDTSIQVALALSDAAIKFSVDGAAPKTIIGNVPPLNQLQVMCNGDGGEQLNGTMDLLMPYPQGNVTDAKLQELATQ
ncbi:MAG: hypothetical protein OXR68_04120 [Alphaproteobacteria bacterium]|nr:hypothetical protein [Alphaproteobacteria bacterium]MDD9919793.1 hypothetical protein [Alphaproteobacteria bacterium]